MCMEQWQTVSVLFSSLIGAGIVSWVTWIVANKTIRASEKPIFTLCLDEVKRTASGRSPNFVISLQNIGGTAKGIEWEFKYSVGGNEILNSGEFAIMGRGQIFSLFIQKTAYNQEDDPDSNNCDGHLPYKLYNGKIRIRCKGLYERNIFQEIPFDIYNQLPPELARDYSRWIEEWRTKKRLFTMVEVGNQNP